MVVWADYLQNVADFLDTTTTQAGIISSLMICICLLVLVLLATKGKGAMVVIPVTEFFCIIFFTYIGWFPVWTGSIIAMVLVLFTGFVLTGFFGGSR
jgi:hypothetical protein